MEIKNKGFVFIYLPTKELFKLEYNEEDWKYLKTIPNDENGNPTELPDIVTNPEEEGFEICPYCGAIKIKEGFKKCSICGEIKSLSEFYPYPQSKDGRRYNCKDCEKKRVKKWKDAKNPRPEKARVPDGYKQCSKCKEIKPTSEFYPDKRAKDGLMSWCKSCKKKDAHRDQNANPERVKTTTRAWQKKNPEKVAIYLKRQRDKKRLKR
jgi:hypothetical protein